MALIRKMHQQYQYCKARYKDNNRSQCKKKDKSSLHPSSSTTALKKNNIASTFKFKSRPNQNKNSKETTLPYFHDQVTAITQELHCNAKERLSQCRKFKSLHLESSTSRGNQKEAERNQNGATRYGTKFNSVTLEPTFPEIERKKIKGYSKSFRNIQDYKEQTYEENAQSNSNAKVSDPIQELITKEVLKTENQAILRQNQIKFDQNQAKFTIQHIRRSNNATKKKKKYRELPPQNGSQERRRNESPQIKDFSPMKTTKIKFETVYPKERKSSNQLPFVSATKNKNARKIPESEPVNLVKGWQNKSISESSQIFDIKEQQDEKQKASTKLQKIG